MHVIFNMHKDDTKPTSRVQLPKRLAQGSVRHLRAGMTFIDLASTLVLDTVLGTWSSPEEWSPVVQHLSGTELQTDSRKEQDKEIEDGLPQRRNA
ncbi:Adhesion G Protein-Coupled Receptor G3 [Manis pentadactyla]|nr:Adhesion G Protein-Coupled Receptor G3 [Manis pentadactyla]